METPLLVIAGVLILLAIMLLRNIIKGKQIAALSKRKEAIVRIGLCLIAAGIIFAIFHYQGNLGWSVLLGVWSSALLIYAITHLFDRLILGE